MADTPGDQNDFEAVFAEQQEEYKGKVPADGRCLLRTGKFLFSWRPVQLIIANSKIYIFSEHKRRPLHVLPFAGASVYEIEFVSLTGKKYGMSLEIASLTLYMNFTTETLRGAWLAALSGLLSGAKPAATSPKPKSTAETMQKDPSSFIFCTYNLNYALSTPEYIGEEELAAASAIEETHASVVCLQETTTSWETFFKTNTDYPYTKFHGCDHKIPAGGIGVLSKYPFEDEIIPSPVGWFPAQLIKVKTPLGLIQILNLHLRPPLTEGALPLPHAYFGSKVDRKKECQVYAKKLDFTQPVIVCGDFNEGETEPSCQVWVKENSMHSALAEHDTETNTWWWDLPLGYKATARFDHVFYKGLSCVDAMVVQRAFSDHYPVAAVFRAIPPPNDKTTSVKSTGAASSSPAPK